MVNFNYLKIFRRIKVMVTANFVALDVITAFLVDDSNRVAFPVDTPALLNRMGVETFLCTFPDQTVAYVVVREENENLKVYVNAQFTVNAQRVMFAEALEVIIPELVSNERFGFIQKQNNNCNLSVFAEELLMPGFAVRSYWATGDSVKKIARKFGVSKHHLENRIINLGLFGLP